MFFLRLFLLIAIAIATSTTGLPKLGATEVELESFGLIERHTFLDLIFEESKPLEPTQREELATECTATVSPAVATSAYEIRDQLELCDYHSDITCADSIKPFQFELPASRPCNVAALLGYEAFRGHPDGGWGNYGLHAGLNVGTRLGRFSDLTGIGMQAGATIGVYDWSGTDYRMQNTSRAETQGFVTYGFFRKATASSRLHGALVHDWMINDTFSVFGEDPTLFQWRGQVGYLLSDWDEAGVWGAWRGDGDTRDVPFFGSTTWRPVNQLNFYWHHKWGVGQPDTWLWLGVPEQDRLTGGGTLGDYIAGVRAECPLSNRVLLYTLITYMHPSASPSPAAAREEAWSWVIGLSFSRARQARTRNVAGRPWTPHLPVATNGYFLVDASQVY